MRAKVKIYGAAYVHIYVSAFQLFGYVSDPNPNRVTGFRCRRS